MAVNHTLQTATNALVERDSPHIKWDFPGNIDTTRIQLLIDWTANPDIWTYSWERDRAAALPRSEKEVVDYLEKRTWQQCTEIMQRSPVPTLHLSAQLIIATWRYVEDTFQRMYNYGLDEAYREFNNHRWAAVNLDKWTIPISDCLSKIDDATEADEEDEYESPLVKRWGSLHALRDDLIALSERLLTTKHALPPQLAEIEHMAYTGQMWVPRVVDTNDSAASRSSSGFIKIRDERGYSADLFVRANADFNDVRLRRRIGVSRQLQWQLYHLPDGRIQIMPEVHSVAMPEKAWNTVARVAAVLQPHAGRQSDIKGILDQPRWSTKEHWLEVAMEAFSQRKFENGPVIRLDDDSCRVRLLNGQTDSASESLSPAPPTQLQIDSATEGKTTEDAGIATREWQEQKAIVLLPNVDEQVDETIYRGGVLRERGA